MKVLPLWSETLALRRKKHHKSTRSVLLFVILFLGLFFYSSKIVAKEIQIKGIKLEKEIYKADEALEVNMGSFRSDDLSVALVNEPTGNAVKVEAEQIENILDVFQTENFRPGKYRVEVKEGSRVIFEKDFLWGVLAINFNKSRYLKDEVASITMAVLNETGNMVCDAEVSLEIAAPDFSSVLLSTQNGGITVNDDCDLLGYTKKPDYEAAYAVSGEGEYKVKLTAKTQNGEYSINDTFEVKGTLDFDIERMGPTRIYPLSLYEFSVDVTANKNFKGILEEEVPAGFYISDIKYDYISASNAELIQKKDEGKQFIRWYVTLEEGDSTRLSYTFDAPDISPFLYLMGNLKFLENEMIIENPIESLESETSESSGSFQIGGSSEDQDLFIDFEAILESSVSESSGSADNVKETTETVGPNQIDQANVELKTAPENAMQNQIVYKEVLIYEEGRKWQIASDAATYTGKYLRTVEYVLGGNASGTATTDNTARASGTLVYAGTSWNTTKGSAGLKNVVINGSGIRVVNAYLDVYMHMTSGGNNDLTNVDFRLDVEGGPAGGADVRIASTAAPFITDMTTSDLVEAYRGKADATALFDRQSDGQFNAGLDVVAGVLHTGGNRSLTSLKLVVTYEQDYSTTSHTETKTVRFPLDSDGSGDTGSMQAACAASGTCDFSYLVNLPDLAASGDIKDVFVEMNFGQAQTTGAATTLTPIHVNDGTTGTSGPAYSTQDALAGQTFVRFYWRPTVGTNDFNPTVTTTNQKVRITMGSGSAVDVLGGELVVTYDYSTGASTQTETVRYFIAQQTATTANTKTDLGTTSIAISNTGLSVKNIWYKANATPTENVTLTVFGTVGSGSERSNAYVFSNGVANTIRAGEGATMYFDLTQDISQFSSSPTNLNADVQWSGTTGDSAIGIEAYVTFTWSGSSGGTVTKTVYFGANPHGVPATASNAGLNESLDIELPEAVTKTHRSTYVESTLMHTNATNITAGTVTIGVDATTAPANETTITENGEEGTTTTAEGFAATYRHSVTNTIFSGGSTIAWKKRDFLIRATGNQANEIHATHTFVVTYDAALGADEPQAPTANKHVRTIEYVLGGNASGTATTDNTARASGTLVYAGTSWNTTKGSAGLKNVVINGSGIRVVNAYLDVYMHMTSGGNNDLTNVDFRLDVEGGPAGGADVRIASTAAPFINDQAASDLVEAYRGKADATALFDRQSDGQFNAGLDVVAGVLHTGGNRSLTSLKLVVTYEQDYSTTSHTETKTVRFPLDSDGSGDTGSMQAACAASGTCDFSYLVNLPDLAASGDIKDVFVEMNFGQAQTTGAATTLTPIHVNDGTTGTSGPAYSTQDALAGQTFVRFYWRPTVGTNDFNPTVTTTNQKVRITMGSGSAVDVLGGELVVTYDYSTGASVQTETVRYFIAQQTATTANTKTDLGTTSIAISNTGLSVKNIWYKVNATPTENVTLTVFGTVGSGSERSNAYVFSNGVANTIRAGEGATMYFDLTQDISQFSSSPTNLNADVQWSGTTGDSAIGIEAYVTFTWSGSSGGTVTKTVYFGANPHGVPATASNAGLNESLDIELPEAVTKTHRSTYIESTLAHTNATNITAGTVTIGVDATTAPANETTVTENGEEGTTTTAEGFAATYRHSVTNTIFSGGSTIAWKKRDFLIRATGNQANEIHATHTFVVTYDAAFGGITLAQNHYRWRDDTAGLNTSSGWLATEDNIYSSLAKSTTVRVRLEIANTGGAPALDYPFRLEFAERTGGTCGDETFAAVPVTATTEHFETVTSSQYVDQASTTSGLLTVTGTFANGRGVEDPANQTVAIDITNGNYTELEYAVQATTNSTSGSTYCFRVTNIGSITNFTYSTYAQATISTSNQSPNSPSSLAQKKTDDTVLATGDWVSATSVKFTASASDPDVSDTLQLCVEKDLLGTSFSNTEDSCGTGVAYSGSPVAVTVTISGLTDASEYHWQARVKDAASAYSSWVSYDVNAESARDFGTDTTAPTGGTVYDGTSTGVDTNFNTGSLSQLSANWDSFNAAASGLLRYDYSIGTTAGGTSVVNWTSNGTATSVTAFSLTLQTSQQYFFNVRTVDNAGNVQSPVISSNGQVVAPSLTFSVSPSTITFSNLNEGNDFNDTDTTTLTTSTNAYNGYVVRSYITSLLTDVGNPGRTISNFNGGTYASPDQWQIADRGFGYHSNDTSVQGSNIFNVDPCPGGTAGGVCYAPFSTTGPGDIIADHIATVSGSAISNEQFTITYQVKTDPTQSAGTYSTNVVYTITAIY